MQALWFQHHCRTGASEGLLMMPFTAATWQAISVVTCMDARVLPDRIFGFDIGGVHIQDH